MRHPKQSAFSLPEIAVALTILGILAVLVTPRAASFLVQARRGEAKVNLEHIKHLQAIYRVEHGSANSSAWKVGYTGAGTSKCAGTAAELLNPLGFSPKGCSSLRYSYYVRSGHYYAFGPSDYGGKWIYPDCSGGTASECTSNPHTYGDLIKTSDSTPIEVCRNIVKYCPTSTGGVTPTYTCTGYTCSDSSKRLKSNPPSITVAPDDGLCCESKPPKCIDETTKVCSSGKLWTTNPAREGSTGAACCDCPDGSNIAGSCTCDNQATGGTTTQTSQSVCENTSNNGTWNGGNTDLTTCCTLPSYECSDIALATTRQRDCTEANGTWDNTHTSSTLPALSDCCTCNSPRTSLNTTIGNANYGKCECPSPKTKWDGTTCVCPDGTVEDGNQCKPLCNNSLNYSDCGVAGGSWIGGSCKCLCATTCSNSRDKKKIKRGAVWVEVTHGDDTECCCPATTPVWGADNICKPRPSCNNLCTGNLKDKSGAPTPGNEFTEANCCECKIESNLVTACSGDEPIYDSTNVSGDCCKACAAPKTRWDGDSCECPACSDPTKTPNPTTCICESSPALLCKDNQPADPKCTLDNRHKKWATDDSTEGSTQADCCKCRAIDLNNDPLGLVLSTTKACCKNQAEGATCSGGMWYKDGQDLSAVDCSCCTGTQKTACDQDPDKVWNSANAPNCCEDKPATNSCANKKNSYSCNDGYKYVKPSIDPPTGIEITNEARFKTYCCGVQTCDEYYTEKATPGDDEDAFCGSIATGYTKNNADWTATNLDFTGTTDADIAFKNACCRRPVTPTLTPTSCSSMDHNTNSNKRLKCEHSSVTNANWNSSSNVCVCDSSSQNFNYNTCTCEGPRACSQLNALQKCTRAGGTLGNNNVCRCVDSTKTFNSSTCTCDTLTPIVNQCSDWTCTTKASNDSSLTVDNKGGTYTSGQNAENKCCCPATTPKLATTTCKTTCKLYNNNGVTDALCAEHGAEDDHTRMKRTVYGGAGGTNIDNTLINDSTADFGANCCALPSIPPTPECRPKTDTDTGPGAFDCSAENRGRLKQPLLADDPPTADHCCCDKHYNSWNRADNGVCETTCAEAFTGLGATCSTNTARVPDPQKSNSPLTANKVADFDSECCTTSCTAIANIPTRCGNYKVLDSSNASTPATTQNFVNTCCKSERCDIWRTDHNGRCTGDRVPDNSKNATPISNNYNLDCCKDPDSTPQTPIAPANCYWNAF